VGQIWGPYRCFIAVIGVAGYVAGPKMRAAFPCAQIAPSSVNPRQLVRFFLKYKATQGNLF
jgi:hypothetical protein